MKYGLWLLSAAAVGGVGTLLAASLPVPPSLPGPPTRHVRAGPTQVAAAPAPSAPAPSAPMTPSAASPAAVPPAAPAVPTPQAAVPPAAPSPRAAAAPPPAASVPPQAAVTASAVPATPFVVRPKRIVAATTAAASHKTRRATRHLAKATPERHRRVVVVHAIPQPPPLYPGMPVRPPTHIAMAPPPPYSPYWRMPYPPDY